MTHWIEEDCARDERLADLARKLIELTREGNGAAAMSLLEQAAGVADN